MAAQVISLGCRLNLSESEQIRGLLAQESDVVVINSCAVTAEAVRQTGADSRRSATNPLREVPHRQPFLKELGTV